MSVRTKFVTGIFAAGQVLGPYGLGKERYNTSHTHSKSDQDMTGSVIIERESEMMRKKDAERKQEYFPHNKLNNIDDEDNSKYVMVADNVEKSICVVPQSVLDNPPSVVEVQAATAAIFSSADVFGQLFGSLTFDKDQMVELFQGVLKVATNPHIIAEAKRNREEYLLNGSDYFRDEEEAPLSSFSSDAEISTPPLDTKHNISTMEDKATSASPLSQASGASAVWRSMAENITCALCVDVYACPVLLRPCSHEFCGMCIHDLASACTSKDVEVSHRCPVCRVDFTYGSDDVTYQQNRDEMICRELHFAPDCPEKSEWAGKRGAYLKLREANKVQQEEEKTEETEKKEEKSFFGSLNLEFSSETIQNAVVVMAVAVLCLIAVMRK